jgi:murein L,D-transpeptidase YafK
MLIAGLIALLAAAGLATLFVGDLRDIGSDYDNRLIGFERARRLAYASFGLSLPGTPNLADLDGRLAAAGLALGAPVFIRILKREFELELWLAKDGRFEHFATYPICRWSGRLGPKLRQGDRQAPEGVYTVSKHQLNPASRWHRSFNLGFPNAYDRSHGRTGSFLMVHGGCSSIGCFAMTNAVIDEIWQIVTAALANGQARFQVQVLPFRMTEPGLAARANHPSAPFWGQLKTASDLFDRDRLPPEVAVCRGNYVFAPARPGATAARPVFTSCNGRPAPAGPAS